MRLGQTIEKLYEMKITKQCNAPRPIQVYIYIRIYIPQTAFLTIRKKKKKKTEHKVLFISLHDG